MPIRLRKTVETGWYLLNQRSKNYQLRTPGILFNPFSFSFYNLNTTYIYIFFFLYPFYSQKKNKKCVILEIHIKLFLVGQVFFWSWFCEKKKLNFPKIFFFVLGVFKFYWMNLYGPKKPFILPCFIVPSKHRQ